MRRMLFIILSLSALMMLGLVAATLSQENGDMSFEYAGVTNAPDFPRGAEWLNTARPYRMEDFRGRIVMLDFWTYCCINCIHVIPDLKRLEAKYPNELVVVGVHSAKFTTEQETENIRQAVLRYELEHPVVNDHEFRMWREYGVRAWPTVALIDPLGKVVGIRSGEGVFDAFDSVIAEMVEHFDGRGVLDRTPLDLQLEEARAPSSLLAFPGKILADETADRLYISDSNHNRIVVSTLSDARVVQAVGSGEVGFSDGAAAEARFDHPQGMALHDGVLYVADTENHAVRTVNTTTWEVGTLAGTGAQARSFNVPGRGRSVALNSPWDLYVHEGTLYVANAGSHQIWQVDLTDSTAQPYAGSGRENRTDGSLRSSALAQPSGLASDGRRLYVADSEVSAVRAVDLPGTGDRVTTLAGGELFEFGLEDDLGRRARFQHPIGVAYHEGVVYVADTYNNAIRTVNVESGRVRTFLGDGTAGSRDSDNARFDEPNDVEIVGDRLYIADTNNHRIRIASLTDRTVTTVRFANPEALMPQQSPEQTAAFTRKTVSYPEQTVRPGASELVVDLRFPDGFHLSPEAPSSATAVNVEGALLENGQTLTTTGESVRVPLTLGTGSGRIGIDLVLYYCEEGTESLCYFDEVRLIIPVTVEAGAGDPQPVEYTLHAVM